MKEKWERHPQRIGMVVGFIALPLLWWLQEWLLYLAFGFRSLNNLELIVYFAGGAIPGTILGAGFSKAIWAGQKNDWRAVKWQLLSHSAFVLALFMSPFLALIAPAVQRSRVPFYLIYLPLNALAPLKTRDSSVIIVVAFRPCL